MPSEVLPENVVASNKDQTKYDYYPIKLYNKIEDNFHLANKKALFLNMKNYYEAMS